MTVGSFKAKYNTPCMECGANISPGDTAFFVKGQHGYWCGECDQKKVSQTAAQTTPEAARQSSKDEYCGQARDDREKAMFDAHRENMDSARQTRDVLANLTVAIVTLRDAIREGKR